MHNDLTTAPSIWDAIANTPRATLILLGLAAVLWIIGGYILVALHYKRLGQPMWTGLIPFKFPFLKFNAKEWRILIVLAIASPGLIVLGF